YQTFDEKPLLMLWKESLYYSVSAITTLGFGDIIPVSNWARAVTMLEAISGIFITIVFIARLASLPTKHAKHS
ncbi:MAG: potassium channel family protein, partial [Planctomycetota bacterium]|nr:potassium channel family protein [Planctomycetota bacterium]